ncbi:MAG: glucuronate isomerase [Clostridiales bacterium]|jgi:glucuronate isomerase|nr:glucuronate isomerase [Clostridiales bacterium]
MMKVRHEILKTAFAERIYSAVKELPILDYHCHLSPSEIYNDKPFDNIGELWLSGDHYKWRLMRSAGIDEKFITGNASWREKFCAFIGCVGNAFGNPLRDWARLELEKYFDCKAYLCGENAEAIWQAANAAIAKNKLSPRRLIELSRVEYIATTDDPSDTLIYHQKLIDDKGFKATVAPTFRVDNLFNIERTGFPEYLSRLADASGIKIDRFSDFLQAIDTRMADFKAVGCGFSDIGIERFPQTAASFEAAEKTFEKVKNGVSVSASELDGYSGFIYVRWLNSCASLGFAAQLHLNVLRNVNQREFARFGADGGYDTVGNSFSAEALKRILNLTAQNGGLPRIIIYTLNPSDYYPLITLAAAFSGVSVGIAWWFNDHKNGILTYLKRMSELSHIGEVIGMLTDSRSFLSYARHDYFRMILAAFLSDFGEENAPELIGIAKRLSYYNTKKLIGGKL